MICAWCEEPLRSNTIKGRRDNILVFIDGRSTKVMGQNVEILDFCTPACRDQYYFGI